MRTCWTMLVLITLPTWGRGSLGFPFCSLVSFVLLGPILLLVRGASLGWTITCSSRHVSSQVVMRGGLAARTTAGS